MAAPEGRAYTGAPVAEVVTTSAHMPAPAPGHGGAGEQRAFVRPQKCIHNKADLDRSSLSAPLCNLLGPGLHRASCMHACKVDIEHVLAV